MRKGGGLVGECKVSERGREGWRKEEERLSETIDSLSLSLSLSLSPSLPPSLSLSLLSSGVPLCVSTRASSASGYRRQDSLSRDRRLSTDPERREREGAVSPTVQFTHWGRCCLDWHWFVVVALSISISVSLTHIHTLTT